MWLMCESQINLKVIDLHQTQRIIMLLKSWHYSNFYRSNFSKTYLSS